MSRFFKKIHIISEENLIHLLTDRPSDGMKILYENYATAIKKQILRIVSNPENAEDILQEVFIKIWKNFPKYNCSKGRLYTWMINISKNEAIDFLRSKRLNIGKFTPMESLTEATHVAHSFTMIPEHIGLRELVGNLQPLEANVLNLIYFEGYSQSEVAILLALPLGTVKTKTRKAYARLKKHFHSDIVEFSSVA